METMIKSQVKENKLEGRITHREMMSLTLIHLNIHKKGPKVCRTKNSHQRGRGQDDKYPGVVFLLSCRRTVWAEGFGGQCQVEPSSTAAARLLICFFLFMW